MRKKIVNIIRWTLGIALILLTIGAFSSGDTIAGSIILILGLLLIPPIPKYLFKLFKGDLNLHSLKIKLLLNSKKFIRELDLKNDNNLIQTIDYRFKHTERVFNDSDKKRIGISVYRNIAISAMDTAFTKDETDKLQKVMEYFHLSEKEISEIEKSLNPQVLSKIEEIHRKSFQEEYSKIYITSLLEKLTKQFGLTSEDVNSTKKKVDREFLDEFLSLKLTLRRISPKDESDIFEALVKLGYSPKQLSKLISVKTFQELKRGKLLWQLENGILTPIPNTTLNLIPNTTLNLKQSEVSYLSYKAKRLEVEAIDKGYSLSAGGLSFPITQNISFGGGLGNAKPIKENVLNEFEGTLHLTNKRVVFLSSANNKSFQVSFEDLLSFNLYSNGIEFLVNQNNFVIQLSSNDLEFFTAALQSSIRNNLKKDNNIYKMAKIELEKEKNIIDV